ncbi:hypothetical protein TNCV_1175501 [Trichonephila clavipes]|nr:hypothetical protein TNCV_1175501 [Trichonephila clavipes]
MSSDIRPIYAKTKTAPQLLHRCFIPFIRVLICPCGNHIHACTKALFSSSMLIGADLRAAIERLKTSLRVLRD